MRWRIILSLLAVTVVALGFSQTAYAQASGAFSLQVSPSPLAATVKPGEVTTLEVKIRNTGSQTETLKIAPRTFKIEESTEKLVINDDKEPDIAAWISFGQERFTLSPGQVMTQKVRLSVPKEAGFSYSFALVIKRAESPTPQPGASSYQASLAIFTLINVDRPGAVRSLEISRFASVKNIYEYLPAEFDIVLKNTGNTIVQPAGTLFIKRHADDTEHIDALNVNDAGGYILPGSSRTLRLRWDNGFQVLKDKESAEGKTGQELQWQWSKLDDIRYGQYSAQLVAIYNNGTRDVPLEARVQFWVIPWIWLIGIILIILLIGVGVWSICNRIIGFSLKKRRKSMRLR